MSCSTLVGRQTRARNLPGSSGIPAHSALSRSPAAYESTPDPGKLHFAQSTPGLHAAGPYAALVPLEMRSEMRPPPGTKWQLPAGRLSSSLPWTRRAYFGSTESRAYRTGVPATCESVYYAAWKPAKARIRLPYQPPGGGNLDIRWRSRYPSTASIAGVVQW
jgi:hypothetical protein